MTKISKLLFLICICVFTVICYNVISYNRLAFDLPVQRFAFSLKTLSYTKIMVPLTYTVNPETIIAACLLLIIFPKTRVKFGIPTSISCLISLFVYKIIKHSVARPRPDTSLHMVTQGGYSFPSGHSMTAVIFYGVLAIIICSMLKTFHKKILVVLLTTMLVLILGFSRIYVGVHWPSDVLAGFMLGCAYLIIFKYVYEHKVRTFP